MQALASKATTALGMALALMLTLLGGLALLGFGLYIAAHLLLAGISNVLGKDVATLLFAVLIIVVFVAIVCTVIGACVRLVLWLYGVFGRTHAQLTAAQADARLTRVDAHGIPPLPRQLLESPQSAAALLTLVYHGLEAKKPPPVPHTLTYAPHLRYTNDAPSALVGPSAPPPDVKDFWALFSGGHLPEHGFLIEKRRDTHCL